MVLTHYVEFLRIEQSIDFWALSNTLCSKRTAHAFRVAFSAKDPCDLRGRLTSWLQDTEPDLTSTAHLSASPARILGIFTGQGAQWAGMASKIMRLPAAIKIVQNLENSLATLSDAPSWSLTAELSADTLSSRVMDPAIAQPACTAIQILLVEILRVAGIQFCAVVGHSSGEIAAAFAAGRLSARDAIRIAYYRGVHLSLVGGPNGEKGSMIAVGASYEEAQAMCNLEHLRGKICVAACNSDSSVTLSGDWSAVQNIKDMCEQQSRFARILRVDNACQYLPNFLRRVTKHMKIIQTT